MTSFQFYFSLITGTILILIPAWFSYIKERSRPDAVIFGAALVGAALSFGTGYNARQESIRSADSAKEWNNRFVKLQSQNLKSAKKIIDSLEIAVNNSRSLINGNNQLLAGQNTNLQMLNAQLNLSTKIHKSVVKSGDELLKTISGAEKNINDNFTGGDAFATIEMESKNQKEYFTVVNLFPIDIPNVRIAISDVTEYMDCSTGDCGKLNTYEIPEMTFYKKTVLELNNLTYKFDESGKIHYLNISIWSRNKYYEEQFRYQYVKEKIYVVYRIRKYINHKLTFFHYSGLFDKVKDSKDFDDFFIKKAKLN